MFALFLVFLLGQTLTGFHEHNEDQKDHVKPPLSWRAYLVSGHYLESLFENWESKFLQMSAYVVFTVFLFQKGSSESKDPAKSDAVDSEPRAHQQERNASWPVKKGGLALLLYEHSLSIGLFTLFLISFGGHVMGGARLYNEDLAEHGQAAPSTIQYLGTTRFWFESFQNWQSEFLAVFTIVFLSIWLGKRLSRIKTRSPLFLTCDFRRDRQRESVLPQLSKETFSAQKQVFASLLGMRMKLSVVIVRT